MAPSPKRTALYVNGPTLSIPALCATKARPQIRAVIRRSESFASTDAAPFIGDTVACAVMHGKGRGGAGARRTPCPPVRISL